MKTTPSANKTEKGDWNNFSEDSLNRFIERSHPKFVDMQDSDWQNSEDTVVMLLPWKLTWYQLIDFTALRADEFDFFRVDKKSVLVRLWWD